MKIHWCPGWGQFFQNLKDKYLDTVVGGFLEKISRGKFKGWKVSVDWGDFAQAVDTMALNINYMTFELAGTGSGEPGLFNRDIAMTFGYNPSFVTSLGIKIENDPDSPPLGKDTREGRLLAIKELQDKLLPYKCVYEERLKTSANKRNYRRRVRILVLIKISSVIQC